MREIKEFCGWISHYGCYKIQELFLKQKSNFKQIETHEMLYRLFCSKSYFLVFIERQLSLFSSIIVIPDQRFLRIFFLLNFNSTKSQLLDISSRNIDVGLCETCINVKSGVLVNLSLHGTFFNRKIHKSIDSEYDSR